MNILPRAQAKPEGRVKYFTGKPCQKAGHIAERYTGSGSCVECKRQDQASIKKEKSEYDKKRYEQKGEQIRARRKENYYKNREAAIEYSVTWNLVNKEKRKFISATYKHKRRAIEKEGMPYSELMEWVKSQPKVCHWCGCKCPDNFHVDHYVPLSRGGQHTDANLVIACQGCNLKKSDKPPEEFALSVGRLI